MFDADGSGTIDVKELKSAMESLGYKEKSKIVYEMLEKMNHSQINFDQFLDMMTAKIVSGEGIVEFGGG